MTEEVKTPEVKKGAEIFEFSLDKRKPKQSARAPGNSIEEAARKAAERKIKEEADRKKHNDAITKGLRK